MVRAADAGALGELEKAENPVRAEAQTGMQRQRVIDCDAGGKRKITACAEVSNIYGG